ncbi:hypothetical protein B484DRAFT_443823 [Ochromonadaceae sp. CCMP2298]|nr:hypothetical protein B484DRAFT_443823 [Ochromonadaceae sp. CCMP2298]|mmetsp:Transcript_11594/g.26038  ORF Transcript_11594/g.26038 Transcript_11594/m.26038 type:complete len:116 (+) Transcript_11594:191-538(+)
MFRAGAFSAKRAFQAKTAVRRFGAGGHHGPHVPEFYDKLGKGLLLTAYLWIMYKLKEDKGQLFGYYQPWLHEHDHDDHEEHLQFEYAEGEEGWGVPLLKEEHEEEEEEEEDEDEE